MKDKKYVVECDLPADEEGVCWTDKDRVMFHACFSILGSFVKDELGPPDDEWTSQYRGFRKHFCDEKQDRLVDLWLWYRDEYPNIVEKYARYLNLRYGGSTAEESPEEEEFPYDYPEVVADKKLRELIDLRRAMWT